jgi:hypothetical protein
LQRGEEGGGELVGIDAGPEQPGGREGSEPVTDGARPLLESGGDERSGFGIAFRELPAERPEGATSPRLGGPDRFDQHVAPGAKTFDAAEIGLSSVIDGGIRLVVDDGLDKIVLVQEVVAKLRSADVRRRFDFLRG